MYMYNFYFYKHILLHKAKALPDKRLPVKMIERTKKPSHENYRADKSPPVKVIGGQKLSRKNNTADKSPPAAIHKYVE
jgi:hypothetical protein